MYRFNGGYGAITCDICGIMFCTDVSQGKYTMLRRIHGLPSNRTADACPKHLSKLEDDLARKLANRCARLKREQNG